MAHVTWAPSVCVQGYGDAEVWCQSKGTVMRSRGVRANGNGGKKYTHATMRHSHGAEVQGEPHAPVCEDEASGFPGLRPRQAQSLEGSTHAEVNVHDHQTFALPKEVKQIFSMHLNPGQWLSIQSQCSCSPVSQALGHRAYICIAFSIWFRVHQITPTVMTAS